MNRGAASEHNNRSQSGGTMDSAYGSVLATNMISIANVRILSIPEWRFTIVLK
jgi:hypothetical protein